MVVAVAILLQAVPAGPAFRCNMISILSSHANGEHDSDVGFVISVSGRVISSHVDDSFGYHPLRFDVNEFLQHYHYIKLPSSIDILDIGYWYGDGSYEPPDDDFRQCVKENKEDFCVKACD